MKQLIIKRSNLQDEYILEVTGYIPKELEDDFECMAEDFEGEEYLLIEEIYEKMLDFRKFHRRTNDLVVNFQINFENHPRDENLTEEVRTIRTVTINIQVRRTFDEWIKELF